MKQKIILRTFLFTAAAALAGTTLAVAADNPAPLPASGAMGLLGQTYAGVSYSYVNLDKSPVNADDYAFEFNQALNPGLDALFHYDFTQAGLHLGDRANDQSLGGALRLFNAAQAWGKPYVEAGVGYEWTRTMGVRDDSFTWEGAAGIEFQAAPALTVTPYIKYEEAHDLAVGGLWKYGVRGNYWVDNQWAVTVGLEGNGNQDMKYTVGTSFRF